MMWTSHDVSHEGEGMLARRRRPGVGNGGFTVGGRPLGILGDLAIRAKAGSSPVLQNAAPQTNFRFRTTMRLFRSCDKRQFCSQDFVECGVRRQNDVVRAVHFHEFCIWYPRRDQSAL